MHNYFVILILVFVSQVAGATTYYISPAGDDSANGTSTKTPWKTCGKVNDSKFAPGDTILFQRGGEWRGHLQLSSSGQAGSPITCDAYGEGPKPRIYGSDILLNAKFIADGDNKYSFAMTSQADSALCNHVFIPSTWNAGTLTITTPTDPRTDGKLYAACLRGNVLFSNRQNHLVFRNLVVDETAGQLNDGNVQGYGIRIEGSTDVLLESCEACRCGRHNIAVINSTAFVGRHLVCSYAVPKMPGGNTAYVSYADAGAPVARCTSEWDDISADHLEDGKGGQYPSFVSHGENQGLITLENSTVTGKISFMRGPVIVRHITLTENASIENWGAGVLIDGVTLLDSSAIDQWGSGGTIQNCVARLTPAGGGPTGYGTAILCRDKAKDNVIRFNTLVTGKFSCLEMAGENSSTKWYANIMLANGSTVIKAGGALATTDVALAEFNFYASAATFSGKSLLDWQAQGFDPHSRSGDPLFKDAAGGKYELQSNSPCLRGAKVKSADIATKDMVGKVRATSEPDIGAFSGS